MQFGHDRDEDSGRIAFPGSDLAVLSSRPLL
jgi:hypothetical protein